MEQRKKVHCIIDVDLRTNICVSEDSRSVKKRGIKGQKIRDTARELWRAKNYQAEILVIEQGIWISNGWKDHSVKSELKA